MARQIDIDRRRWKREVLPGLIEKGWARTDGSITPAGELELHQLRLLEWIANRAPKIKQRKEDRKKRIRDQQVTLWDERNDIMPPMTPPKDTHPQVLPPEFYEWNQRTIQASHRNGTAITVEEALCYGPLVVHPILGDDDRIDDIPNGNQFAITSTYGGGRLLCATISADDAFKIVHRLVDNKVTCAALCKKDHLTIVAHLKQMTPWVIPWLMDCRQQGKYLSTKPYRKGIVS